MQTLLQITNATGHVTFENTTTGSYTFKIIKQGYPETNETFAYSGQPLTLTIPLTATNSSNGNSFLSNTNQIVVVAIIAVVIVIAVVGCVLIIKRRKSPNIKNLQALKKQMQNKNP
jgi:carbamoylphosphate synthase small subunit